MKSKIKHWLNLILFGIKPGYILVLIALFTFIFSYFLPSIKFNYNIEGFFSSADPEVSFYEKHKSIFENENDYVLLGIRNNNGIFQKDFLIKLEQIEDELIIHEAIEKIYSPTNLFEYVKGPLGSFKIPLIHINDTSKYESDELKIYSSELYKNTFFSLDKSSVSLLIKKSSEMTKVQNDSLLNFINNVVLFKKFDEYHLAGRIKTQNYYVGKMQKQMMLFSILAFFLFLLSLYIVFKNFQYVFLSLIPIFISLIWILGIIGFLGIKLDLMLTLVPSIIIVISTSGSIHFINRFNVEYSSDLHKSKSIKLAVSETGLPNFLNALTTSIGFASLIMIPVIPIQRFGIITSVGILISFTISLFVTTSILRLSKPILSTIKNGSKLFQSWVIKLIKRPLYPIMAFSIIIALSAYFSSKVEINNHFLDDLNETSSLKHDLKFFEDQFSGIRPFEINIKAKKGYKILDFESVKEIDKVEKYLLKNKMAGSLFSPVTILKGINKALHGGKRKYYRIPTDENNYKKLIKEADSRNIWLKYIPVLSAENSVARISGRNQDIGSSLHKVNNDELKRFINENTKNLNFTVTGAAHLMDNANLQIAKNLSLGIILAVIVATIIIGLFTSSWKLALISLIPNLTPLLLVAGFMGISGISLKVSTAMIFTIVYGIAVDDTIHFLNSYRLNKKLFKDQDEVIRNTLLKMWKPMLFTSLILFSGFMIFTLSEFSSISNLGFLIGGAIVTALLADLILLPALLYIGKK